MYIRKNLLQFQKLVIKRLTFITILFLFIALIYRSFKEYRIIGLSDSGDIKYKEGDITYFPQPPFSIINPFKKSLLLNKIKEYCRSDEFDNYYTLKNYNSKRHIKFSLMRKEILQGSFKIKAITNDQNNLLILVHHIKNQNLELVFILDKSKDKIIGYF